MIAAFLRALVSSLLGRWFSSWWEGRQLRQAAIEHVDNAVMIEQLKEVADVHAAQTAVHDGRDPALAAKLQSQYVD